MNLENGELPYAKVFTKPHGNTMVIQNLLYFQLGFLICKT